MKINKSRLLENFAQWSTFLNENVAFHMQKSLLHTKQHCSRVLFYALLLSELLELSDSERKALAMAACFHDYRRIDDTLDTDHGERAAKYYKKYCKTRDLEFDPRTYYVMAYHDRDDEIGKEEIRNAFPEEYL